MKSQKGNHKPCEQTDKDVMNFAENLYEMWHNIFEMLKVSISNIKLGFDQDVAA